MMDKLIGALIGFVICKVLSGAGDVLSNIFHVSHPSSGPAPTPSPASTTTVVNFPTATPGGLPPWPSGWRPVKHLTQSIISRAEALLPVLATGEHKLEKGPDDRWITYYKYSSGGKTGVTAHEPKVAVTSSPATAAA